MARWESPEPWDRHRFGTSCRIAMNSGSCLVAAAMALSVEAVRWDRLDGWLLHLRARRRFAGVDRAVPGAAFVVDASDGDADRTPPPESVSLCSMAQALPRKRGSPVSSTPSMTKPRISVRARGGGRTIRSSVGVCPTHGVGIGARGRARGLLRVRTGGARMCAGHDPRGAIGWVAPDCGERPGASAASGIERPLVARGRATSVL